MNSKGVAVILVLMFGLAVGVGVVAGKLSARLSKDPTPPPAARRGTLADELNLSPAQNTQMQKIWQEIKGMSDQWDKEADKIRNKEDEKVKKRILKTEEQQKEFTAIRDETTQELNHLKEDRQKAFDDAVEQTVQILDDRQCRLYGQIIKDKIGALPPKLRAKLGGS